MSVSHEAIYAWIYALTKGELAASEIALRTGRTRRQPRGRARSKGARIVGMVSISHRPEETEGRKIPGHWEGDLVIGKAGKTAMGTLAERKSRYLAREHDNPFSEAQFKALKYRPGFPARFTSIEAARAHC